jgi:hypothetical protein
MCYVISLHVFLKKIRDVAIPKKKKGMPRSMIQKKEEKRKGVAMSNKKIK